MEKNTNEWNPEEKMSKDFAIGVIEDVQRFYQRLYYQPKTKPFNTNTDFECAIKRLNGLKELIEETVKE